METETMSCVPPTSTMNPTRHSQREASALNIITRWIRTLRILPCEDCQVEPATRLFLHLRGTEHWLCPDCFLAADHEDNYLQKRICIS